MSRPARVGWEFNLGAPAVPPRVAGIALTDRDDGTVWWLSLRSSDQRTRIEAPVPAKVRAHVYGPYDGPVLPHPQGLGAIRLLVRGGRLGYETISLRIAGARVLYKETAGAAFGISPVYEIVVPAGWTDGDRLAFQTAPV